MTINVVVHERQAIATYLNDQFVPVDGSAATMVKVIFNDDGTVLFVRPQDIER